MNEYTRIFGIKSPPSQVVFYKHNEAFSCEPGGIRYENGIIRWNHNISIKRISDYKYRPREKIKYLGRAKGLRLSSSYKYKSLPIISSPEIEPFSYWRD